ncbi:MAG: sensor histidine kinase [Myxococcota bacterium]|nr:sensor histidine kinase [Myxococcota bacterium]
MGPSDTTLHFYLKLMAMTVMLCAVCSCAQERREQPVAVDGVIDLSDWDFERDGVVDLQGEWRFAWEALIEPMSSEQFRQLYPMTMAVPGRWSHIPEDPLSGSRAQLGYATYALEIRLPPNLDSRMLAISSAITNCASLWRVYSEDGKRELGVVSHGQIGKSIETTSPQSHEEVKALATGGRGSIVLWVQVSNYRDQVGGIQGSPQLGERNMLLQNHRSRFFRSTMVLGGVGILCLVHLMLYWQRREDVTLAYFAFFSFFIALRLFWDGGIIRYLGFIDSGASYQILLIADFIATAMAIMSSLLFIGSLVSTPMYHAVSKFFGYGIGCIFIVWTLTAGFYPVPSLVLTNHHLFVLEIYAVTAVLWLLSYLIYMAFKGHQLARWVCLAFLILGMGVVNDVLYMNGVIRTGIISSYAFVGFILVQTGLLSKKTVDAHRRVEQQSVQLDRALRDAKSADKLKGELLANLSHERRTPLNALTNTPRILSNNLDLHIQWRCEACDSVFRDDADTMPETAPLCPNCEADALVAYSVADSNLDPHTIDSLLQQASRSGAHLEKTLTDIMEYAKLQSDTKAVQTREVSIAYVFREAADQLSQFASKKEIDVRIDIAAEVTTIWANNDQIVLLLLKLLENALEFSPPFQEVVMKAKMEANGRSVCLSVCDQGPGIAEENLSLIFESFRQVEGGHTRTHPGVGLGLSIAQEIAVRHGTHIRVNAVPGQGSTFSFTLPATQAPSEQPSA